MAVPDRLVCCDACNMWIEFEISGLECDFKSASSEAIVFVCDKCVKLKELEELLKSCSCVWTEVGNSRAVSSAVAERDCCEVVPTCNGFDVLPVEELRDVDDGNEVSQEGNSEWLVVDEVRGDCDVIGDGSVVVNSGKWGQEKSKGRMVLCGDSLVRYVDREFCRADKAKRVRVCLPGAKIQDVSNRVNKIVSDEEVVVVQVGTNNVQKESQNIIQSRYHELMCRLASTRAKVVICSLLPRFDNKVLSEKIVTLNGLLYSLCADFGFTFVDMWSSFQGRRDLFARDGLHLANTGASLFGRMVNYSVEQLCLN
ncbi:hypothetical protein BSL78_22652 [Apostichopus japonicus]|uniref:OSK domain-containing protein n=1 Tax=Stichopus japonicus TaxID=307972 RepID=A0A2G8JXI8_STIJA|nr:hypothetical protein BSL78_22652 [Apostichopus japonicus]